MKERKDEEKNGKNGLQRSDKSVGNIINSKIILINLLIDDFSYF